MFHRVKELLKLTQTWYGLYHAYVETRKGGILATACFWKELGQKIHWFFFFVAPKGECSGLWKF